MAVHTVAHTLVQGLNVDYPNDEIPPHIQEMVEAVLFGWFECWHALRNPRICSAPLRCIFVGTYQGGWCAVELSESMSKKLESAGDPKLVHTWEFISLTVGNGKGIRDLYSMIEKTFGGRATCQKPPGFFDGVMTGGEALRSNK